MPSLLQIALRYLMWMLGLFLVHLVAVNVMSLPPSQAVSVMLAAVPALVVANYMVETASRALILADWAVAWGIMLAVYLVVSVFVPVVMSEQLRVGLADPRALQDLALVVLAVAVMLALFLFIGRLVASRRD